MSPDSKHFRANGRTPSAPRRGSIKVLAPAPPLSAAARFQGEILMGLMSFLLGKKRSRRAPISKQTRLLVEALEDRCLLSGTWQGVNPLPAALPTDGGVNPSKDNGTATLLLLSDGNVMVQGGFTGGNPTNSAWFQLAPDTAGNYADGSWSALRPMPTPSAGFAANVLPDGRVFVAGGTDSVNPISAAAVYDPVAGSWQAAPDFPDPATGSSHFGTGPSEVTANGNVLVGAPNSAQTYAYSPLTNSGTASTSNHAPILGFNADSC